MKYKILNGKAVKLILSVILCLFPLTGCGEAKSDANMFRIHFIDVGQADSILLQSPQGTAILIDGGNNNDGNRIVSYLTEQGVKHLDAVVATHPHEDHIGGLDTVLTQISVDKIYMPKALHTTKTYEDFILAANSSGAEKIQAKAGVKLEVPGFEGVFLAPVRSEYEDLNNYSAVLKIIYGDTSFLLTGDAERLSEEEMMKNGNLSATVLKVGHHGSNTSTTKKFLQTVAPEYGIISVGKNNDYGHPHKEVLQRLKTSGVKVLRTDELGTIVLESNGKTIISPY